MLDAQMAGRPPLRPGPGHQVDDFAAADLARRPVERDQLTAGTLVGFFTTDCAPCKELLPRFVDHVAGLGVDPDDVVAVLAAPTAPTAPTTPAADEAMIAQLSSVARVVVQAPDGPMVRAFDLSGFPTLVRMGPDGTVEAAGASLDAIRPRPTLVPASAS
ncbi:TlpA family protein disulfide reductase [Catenulispora yoronensis]